MNVKDFTKVFSVILVIHLMFIYKQDYGLVPFTKVLLLISLISFFYHKTVLRLNHQKLVFAGLIIVAFGHVFSGGGEEDYNRFLLSLLVFFAGNIILTIGFFLENKGQKGIVQKFIIPGLLPAIAGFLMFWFFMPYMNELKIPVGIFSISVATLVAAALNRSADTLSYSLVAGSASLFMVVDFLMGYQRFVAEIAHFDVIFVSIFYVALYCLVVGLTNKTSAIEKI